MQLKRREGKQTSGRQEVHIKFVILAQGPSLYVCICGGTLKSKFASRSLQVVVVV